jgi:tRNA (guanine-N7-)-methyltransferase
MTENDPTGASGRGFFGRRKGHRLRPRQAGLLETLLPRLALDLDHAAPSDLASIFAVPISDVRLEIGFGSGEHLIAAAQTSPGTGFIGCEPFVNGMAKTLAEIDARGVRNVRLHHGDATVVIDWLPAGSIGGIDLLYPDPWPKRRHWKRRFVQDQRLRELARLLRPGALFRFASDSADYVAWTLIRLLRSPDFMWTAERADDWRRPWPGFDSTRYEAKAMREGRAPCYLVFERR